MNNRNIDLKICEMIQRNFEYYFEIMSKTTISTKKLKYVISNIPHPLFNSVLSTHLAEEVLEAIIPTVIKKYKQRSHTWWISDLSTPPNIKEELLRHHYSAGDRYIGLSLELTNYSISECEEKDFLVLRLTDSEQLSYWIYPFLEHHRYKHVVGRKLFEQYQMLFAKNENLIHLVVFYQEQPVGCGSILITGEFAGFYNIGFIDAKKQKKIMELLRTARMNIAKECGCAIVGMQLPEAIYKQGYYNDFQFRMNYQSYLLLE